MPSAPTARTQLPQYPTVATAGARGFLLWNEGPQQTAHLYFQRFTANTWETVAPMPTSRWALAATAGKDGKIYVIGGIHQDGVGTGQDMPTVEVFTP